MMARHEWPAYQISLLICLGDSLQALRWNLRKVLWKPILRFRCDKNHGEDTDASVVVTYDNIVQPHSCYTSSKFQHACMLSQLEGLRLWQTDYMIDQNLWSQEDIPRVRMPLYITHWGSLRYAKMFPAMHCPLVHLQTTATTGGYLHLEASGRYSEFVITF